MTKKDKIVNYLLTTLVVLLPLMVIEAMFVFTGRSINSFNIFTPGSYSTDEVYWWLQIKGMIKNGMPLGYFGYEGNIAKIGTFGNWPFTNMIPYAIFGLIFGWHNNSIVISNILILSTSLAIFMCLTKPNNKQKIWIIVMTFCSSLTLFYLMTSMVEISRASIGLIALGVIINIKEGTNKPSGVKLTLFIVYLIYAIVTYYPYLIFVPIFVYELIDKSKVSKNVSKNIIYILISTIIGAIIIYIFRSLFCSSYVASTSELSYSQYLSKYGAISTFAYLIRNFITHLKNFDIGYLINNIKDYGEVYFMFYIKYIVIIVVSAIYILKGKKDNILQNKLFLSLYIITAFLIGVCLLGYGDPHLLARSLSNSFFVTLMLLVFVDDDSHIKLIVITLTILSIFTTLDEYRKALLQNEQSKNQLNMIEGTKEILDENIHISKNNKWQNTIAMYGDLSVEYLEIPDGLGLHFMGNLEVSKAKYAIYTNQYEKKYKSVLIKNGYKVIFENDTFTLFENK